MVMQCCVPSCKRTFSKGCGVSFHGFPLDPLECQEWMKAVNLKGFKHQFSYYKICSDHFKPTDYIQDSRNSSVLRKGAVPSNLHVNSETSPPNSMSSPVHQELQNRNGTKTDSSSSHALLRLANINAGDNVCDVLPSFHHLLGLPNLSEQGLLTRASNPDATTDENSLSSLEPFLLSNHGSLLVQALSPGAATEQVPSPSPCQLLVDGGAPKGDTSCTLKATEDILFRCSFCSYVTRDRRGIMSHLVAHWSGQQLQCQHCSVVFGSKYILYSHIQMHTSDTFFKCPSAPNASLRGQSTLILKQKLEEQRPHKCQQCPWTFRRACDLTYHVRRHTGEEPYQCEQCPKAFPRKTLLNQHSRTHTGDTQPYKCKVCSEAFSQRTLLTNHFRMHGKNPYQCKQCPKAYAFPSQLTYHNRTHDGHKPFQCIQCAKAFTNPSSLTIHSRTHRGNAYQCKQCPKAFSKARYLTSHSKIHAGVKPSALAACYPQ